MLGEMDARSVDERYQALYERLKRIKDEYDGLENNAQNALTLDKALVERRKKNLREQLAAIEDCRPRIKAFINTAEKNLKSRNHSSIVPREIDFNKLRNWAMMIGSADLDEHGDDPYARRIHYLCLCNMEYLSCKQKDFEGKLAELEEYGHDLVDGADEQDAELQRRRASLEEQCVGVVSSQEFREFCDALQMAHAKHADPEYLQQINSAEPGEAVYIGLGKRAKLLPVTGNAAHYAAKDALGSFYDMERGIVFLPVTCDASCETVIAVGCSPSKTLQAYLAAGLQNYLLGVVRTGVAEGRKICFIDTLHFNRQMLGKLGDLEGTVALSAVPRSMEQAEIALQEIVSLFGDIDEKLGVAESVVAFNREAEPDDRIVRTLLVVIGSKNSFTGPVRKYLDRIVLNYERYGISLVLVDAQYAHRRDNGNRSGRLPLLDAAEDAYCITMLPRQTLLRQGSGPEHSFEWYELGLGAKERLSESFIDTIRSLETKHHALGNVYTDRFPMDSMPEYERGKRTIKNLPFGIDASDAVSFISFDNENFAAYLMGASGSGKSSLLHTLIAGIMREYHPDDVELWLADFKMVEFAQYIDPLPPHVKYILLDESPELVYDLIEKLNERMLERQRYFTRTGKKFEDTGNVYMPMIFVILDEFSIMSQAVALSPTHKLMLQNLLAKGRALGFKFIFASQTFSKGVAGLTSTAKDQIQMRIAMKNSFDEINEALALTANTRTDQVRNWMEALPPHYTLTKYRDGDQMHVKRLQTMYFAGKGAEAFEPIKLLSQALTDGMVSQSGIEMGSLAEFLSANDYIDKEPVVVDGNSYRSYEQCRRDFLLWRMRMDASPDSFGDELFLSLGTPRLMESIKPVVLLPESRENILLVSSGENTCAAALCKSAMLSMYDQGAKVRIWSYERDRIYAGHRCMWDCENPTTDLHAIAQEMRDVRSRLEAGQAVNEIILIFGLERLLSEFEFVGGGERKSGAPDLASMKGVMNLSEEESQKLPPLSQRIAKGPMLDKDCKSKNLPSADKRGSEVVAVPHDAATDSPKKGEQTHSPQENIDFILHQGSRLGCHLLVVVPSSADLRQAKIRLDLFRHRIAFNVSRDESIELFSKGSTASELPSRVCVCGDALETFSLRPYMHEGITWDGWIIDGEGRAIEY